MTKITIDREAMRILIDELADGNFAICPEIMKMLDGAAQPADAQPVAWPTPEDIQRATEDAKRFAVLFEAAAPPVPAAVPLTDEQFDNLVGRIAQIGAGMNEMMRLVRVIERAHGIGDKP
jgi:hypothetical protein